MIRLEKFSYRFAEQVLNSNLAIKQEIEDVRIDSSIDSISLSRTNFNQSLNELFFKKLNEYFLFQRSDG